MPRTFVHDPNDVLDYAIQWANELNTSPEDSIASSSWVVEAGITKDNDTIQATRAVIWLSGGTAGQTYDLTNTIITTLGRTISDTIRVIVQEQ